MAGNVWLRIDVSPLQKQIDEMKSVMAPRTFQRCMGITVKEVGTRLKTQIARAVRQEYNVPYGRVLGAISTPKFTGSGAAISCRLDLKDPRIKIKNYGKGNSRRKRAIYAKAGLHARIAKVDQPLPTSGPNAHYVKRSSGQVIVFTGGTFTMKERFHTKNATGKLYTVKKKSYRQGVGVAIPQMPMNRSENAIQEWTREKLMERLKHNAIAMGKGYIRS